MCYDVRPVLEKNGGNYIMIFKPNEQVDAMIIETRIFAIYIKTEGLQAKTL
jgi:hypothetical protein